MIARKLRLVLNGQAFPTEHLPFHVPPLEEVQKNIGLIARRLGYFLLVETLRAYLRLIQFSRVKYELLKTKVAERRSKNDKAPKQKEPNRFLRAIAEYKRKLGKIKQEIKEEENL